MTSDRIEIDGSFGEGGGQILRTSLALSLLTGQSFHLRNLRSGRSKPGLQPQHLMGVRSAATIGQAEVKGDALGSRDLVFVPGKVKAGSYRFDIRTAGSTGLLLQALYLPLALGAQEASELTLVGGTHVSTSPCYHFLDVTWRRYLRLFGLEVGLRLVRPGFYPRGGGTAEVAIRPCERLRGRMMTGRGPVSVRGFSAVAGLPDHVLHRQARRARVRLEQAAGVEAEIGEERWEGGPGSVLAVVVEGGPVPALFFGLGARGKPAEAVADEAVGQALDYLRAAPAAVDPHSADQIVLPLALADGPSEYTVAEVTEHLLTNAAVIRRFVDREITIEGARGEAGRVRIG